MHQELVLATMASASNTEMSRVPEVRAVGVKVRCAICGYTCLIGLRHDYAKGKYRQPDIWLCDAHRAEWNV
jgi:hypothetical protein